MKKKVAFIFGTRPEVIKLAPVILRIKKINKLQAILVSTGQHDRLLKDGLAAFNLTTDVNFEIMKQRQTLSYIFSQAVAKLDSFLTAVKPNITVVVGDASSTLAGALASFYHKMPVVHIEAGCRSNKIYEPFPEEVNRRLIAAIASWHFPATKISRDNLIREGYDSKRIFLVGSTEADAIDWILKNTSDQYLFKVFPNIEDRKKIAVITTHRRESWGKPLWRVFSALKYIANSHPNIHFIYSVHPNPLVLQPARKILSGINNLIIIPHIPTVPFVHLVSRASFIMTDSGGVQLQAGVLLKPALIFRNVTEWSELIEAGIGRLVGTNKQAIISSFEQYVANHWPKKIPTKPIYPKGAAEKIVKVISAKILA